MADFVAILSKTIDGLGERNTADMRQRVYERARKAIADKLAAISPPPSKAQSDRQYQLLDTAIAELESRYAPKPSPVAAGDPLADFLASVDDELVATPISPPVQKAADAFRQAPLTPFPNSGTPFDGPAAAPVSGMSAKPPADLASTSTTRPDPVLGLDHTEVLDVPSLPGSIKRAPKPAAGGAKGMIFALLGLLVIGGAGYAGYTYKDRIAALFSGQPANTPEPAPAAPAKAEPAAKPADQSAVAQPQPVETQQAAPAEVAVPKLTQRLTPDGQEIDAGPGTKPVDVGEGTSVASATTPSGQAPAAPENQPQTEQSAIAVGHKAIFYEEKTGTEQGTADQGSVVWSVVQDSPGLDQPPEPAIRGEISIPEKGIGMRMTIKRNVDKSLPASHIIEMLFTTPEGFSGGAIENVSRFSLKDTEQAPGNPVVGVPAAFGDGFFLIALTDERTAIDTNMQLLEKQSWIDIPVAYRTGRRALLSFEKGLSGDKVFKEVLDAWKAKQAG